MTTFESLKMAQNHLKRISWKTFCTFTSAIIIKLTSLYTFPDIFILDETFTSYVQSSGANYSKRSRYEDGLKIKDISNEVGIRFIRDKCSLLISHQSSFFCVIKNKIDEVKIMNIKPLG